MNVELKPIGILLGEDLEGIVRYWKKFLRVRATTSICA